WSSNRPLGFMGPQRPHLTFWRTFWRTLRAVPESSSRRPAWGPRTTGGFGLPTGQGRDSPLLHDVHGTLLERGCRRPAVSKTLVRASVPRVRIPPPPPQIP